MIEERPDPKPGAGQVVLKVGRVGICGTDLHMTSGHGAQYPVDSIPGHEYVADVLASDHTPGAMITDTVSLDHLPTKFETMRASSSADCKVMIDPWAA